MCTSLNKFTNVSMPLVKIFSPRLLSPVSGQVSKLICAHFKVPAHAVKVACIQTFDQFPSDSIIGTCVYAQLTCMYVCMYLHVYMYVYWLNCGRTAATKAARACMWCRFIDGICPLGSL